MTTHSSHMILGDARFRYYPLWETRRNDVFCYLCQASWDVGADHLLSEEELGAEFDDARRLSALDHETLRTAIDEANRVAGQYGVMKLLIPVHFSTLADAEATESYTDFCAANVWSVVDSLYFEILRPPQGASREQLAGAADVIRSFGQGVLLRVQTGFDGFSQISGDDFLSVGLDLRGDGRAEDEVLSAVMKFAAAAEGAVTHLHGLETVTLTAAALSAGFDFVGSDAIAPPLEWWDEETDMEKASALLKSLLAARQD